MCKSFIIPFLKLNDACTTLHAVKIRNLPDNFDKTFGKKKSLFYTNCYHL